MGIISCVIVYFIGRELFNEWAGFIAGILCACYGLFIFFEGLLIYAALSLLFSLFAFLYILHIKDNTRPVNMLAFGFFLGLATITQGNIILFGFLAVLWLLFQNKAKLRERIKLLSFFIIGFALVLGMLVLRSYVVEKDISPVAENIGFNFFVGNNAGADGTFKNPDFITGSGEGIVKDARIFASLAMRRQLKPSEVSNFWACMAMNYIRQDPLGCVRLLVKKTAYVFSPHEFIYEPEYYLIYDKIKIFRLALMDLRYVLPFALLGMTLGISRIKALMPLYIAVFSFALSGIIFFVNAKFRIGMVPFLAIFAAFGFIRTIDYARRRQLSKFLLCIIFAAFIFIYNSLSEVKAQVSTYYNINNAFTNHFEAAKKYIEENKFKDALRELRLAEKLEPDNPDLYYFFGIVFYEISDYTNAEKKFKKAVAARPFFADGYYNLGIVYNKEGRFYDAIRTLQRCISLEPDDYQAHFELGLAKKGKGDFDGAKKEFELTLKYASQKGINCADSVKKEMQGLGKTP